MYFCVKRAGVNYTLLSIFTSPNQFYGQFIIRPFIVLLTILSIIIFQIFNFYDVLSIIFFQIFIYIFSTIYNYSSLSNLLYPFSLVSQNKICKVLSAKANFLLQPNMKIWKYDSQIFHIKVRLPTSRFHSSEIQANKQGCKSDFQPLNSTHQKSKQTNRDVGLCLASLVVCLSLCPW